MNWRVAIAMLVCGAASPLAAQPPAARAQVFLSGDEVGSEVFEILANALARDDIALSRSDEAPACDAVLEQGEPQVWMRWTAHGGGTVRLCFRAGCRSAQRELGPFLKLDARAREELLTVIESGLGALQTSCPEAGAVAPHEEVPQAASAAPKPERAELREVNPEAAPTQAAAPARAPSPSMAVARERAIDSPPPAAETDREHQPTLSHILLGASYGLQRWTGAVLSHQLGAAAAYAVQRLPAYVGLDIAYTPPFRAQSSGLKVDATCVRLGLQFWTHVRLTGLWSLDAHLGPAIEWLWLSPEPMTARSVAGPRSTVHGDPLLFARIGPALRLYSALFLGAEMQLDAAWIQRSFGFASAAGPKYVFAPDRLRLSFAVNARVEL